MEDFSIYNPDGSILRKAQLKMLEILDEVVLILERNNIHYWLDGGTALGAVRHKGFIPWDDDLDIDISIEDYKKAIDILQKELPNNLHLQCKENTQTYKNEHFKIRDKHSIFNELGSENILERGIFIDVFPAKKTNYFIQNKINNYFKKTKKYRIQGLKKTFFMFTYFRSLIFIFEFLSPFLRKNAFVTLGFEEYCFPIKIVNPLSTVEFEGKKYSCVNDLDLYLKIHYGEYMRIPSTENRIVHSSEIIFNS